MQAIERRFEGKLGDRSVLLVDSAVPSSVRSPRGFTMPRAVPLHSSETGDAEAGVLLFGPCCAGRPSLTLRSAAEVEMLHEQRGGGFIESPRDQVGRSRRRTARRGVFSAGE